MNLFTLFSLFVGVLLQAQLFVEAVTVNVGLMYSLSRVEDNLRKPSPTFTQSLASTIALINELNDDQNPLTRPVGYSCDVDFEFTVIDTVSDFSKALAQLEATGGAEAFDVLLVLGRSSTCVPVSFVSSTGSIPVISASCTTPELDDALTHRFFGRTIPSDSSVSKSLVKLLTVLPEEPRTPTHPTIEIEDPSTYYDKVTVLYQEDVYGSEFKDALFEIRGDGLTLELIPFKKNNENSIKSAVRQAADTKLNIIICIVFLDDFYTLVDAAIEQELMNGDETWIFTDGVVSASEIALSATPKQAAALNNSFLVLADAGDVAEVQLFDQELYTTQGGYIRDQLKEFLPTGSKSFTEAEEVSSLPLETSFEDIVDQLFDAPEKPFNDFSLFAYDAILTIREIYDRALSSCPVSPLSGDVFLRTMTREGFGFSGLTGDVTFDSETASRDDESARMQMFNLRFQVNGDVVSGEDVVVGNYQNVWEIDNDSILFPGGSSIAPLKADLPESVEIRVIENAEKTTVFFFAGTIIAIALLLILFVMCYGEMEVIAASQPLFLAIMLVGVVISTSAVFVLYVEPQASGATEAVDNDMRCNVSYNMISIGLTLSYAALIVKLQRLLLIDEQMKRQVKEKIPVCSAFKYMFLAILVNLVIIIIVGAANPLVYATEVIQVDQFGQPIEIFNVCAPSNPNLNFLFALYVIFYIVIYMYSLRLIFQVRNLSDDFQEGRWISISILAQLQLLLLGISVVIAVGPEEPSVSYLVVSLLVVLSNFMLLILLFGPKFYKILSGNKYVVFNEQTRYEYETKNDTVLYKNRRFDKEVQASIHDTVATNDLFEMDDSPL